MSPLRGARNNKSSREIAQMSLLMVVPAILIASPLIGLFAGQWADEKFNTEPFLLILGLLLGFWAAAREIFNLVKKSEAMGKENDKENEFENDKQ